MKTFIPRLPLSEIVSLAHSRAKEREIEPASSPQSETPLPEKGERKNPFLRSRIRRRESIMRLSRRLNLLVWRYSTKSALSLSDFLAQFQYRVRNLIIDERGDVPGWVLVVLMTTGLVTGIWTVAAPRIESLLRGSLDSMNNVR